MRYMGSSTLAAAPSSSIHRRGQAGAHARARGSSLLLAGTGGGKAESCRRSTSRNTVFMGFAFVRLSPVNKAWTDAEVVAAHRETAYDTAQRMLQTSAGRRSRGRAQVRWSPHRADVTRRSRPFTFTLSKTSSREIRSSVKHKYRPLRLESLSVYGEGPLPSPVRSNDSGDVANVRDCSDNPRGREL